MDTLSPLLQWEMYAPGTALCFSAVAEGSGIRLVLQRDDTPILCGAAADTTMLLRVSQELRDQLKELGYVAMRPATPMSALEGGPCWGPAAPLQSSLVQTMLSTNAYDRW